ncbi:hypothetical protein [Ferroacidibacillus organovorans]|uniref:Uncharacterized protein n=1 Tax=Ferroacidibacillus organovorans TaxID=1765683 RepID=A0A101XS31_9BACL|nr:hypothetical protein [Ferroacidibacillus organovorans]KUO96522.1 hypothetical protein ATW55_14630 [Ferroacidibacillus organovorans]
MPYGTWAFLHETVIYEYLMHRFNENQLRLRHIIINGLKEPKERWLKVTNLQDITNTRFPDINSITIKKDTKGERPAEVKFTTSMFDYHRSKHHVKIYNEFVEKNGCIIVLKHDTLPKGILDKQLIDVFQLDESDFTSFARENFVRFLNRQIRSHQHNKTWLMIQSKNFYEDNKLAASQSNRWCPTDNLTVFDLSIDDKIIFIRTKGASKQNVNMFWSRHRMIYSEWFLSELWIGKVTSPIQSRKEYCDIYGWEVTTPLWYDETEIGRIDKKITQRKSTGIRWNRVFEFKKVQELKNLNIQMNQMNEYLPEFVHAVIDIYTGKGSREISTDLYVSVMEYIAGYTNGIKENLLVSALDTSELKLTESTPFFH